MKRRFVVIAVLLAVGAAINVAVAWIGALTVDIGAGVVSELYSPLPDDHHWEVFRWDNGPGNRIVSQCWSGPAPRPANLGDPADLLSGWGHIEPPDRDRPQPASHIDEAWGFPMRSMSCRFESRPGPAGAAINADANVLRLRGADRSGAGGLYLPLKPVAPGFAVDTLLYAMLAMVLYAAARDITGVVRRRQAAAAPTGNRSGTTPSEPAGRGSR